MPIDTRPPMIKPMAAKGILRNNPPRREISRVCVRSYTIPTIAKKRAVMTPWENICIPAPTSPFRAFTPAAATAANPIMTSPMCETEEKPMTYLKSVWIMAINAP